MALIDKIEKDVDDVVDAEWGIRNGRVIPSNRRVRLGGEGVRLNATFLYADVANSSAMASFLKRRDAAKILKSFLAVSTRLIKENGGKVTSFDGDRVLGLFHGESKNMRSVKCGLQINWAAEELMERKFDSQYKRLSKNGIRPGHGVGIDTGGVLIVRAGQRRSNDLIAIGRAPNMAARLSGLRQRPYRTYVSHTVYSRLSNELKYRVKDNRSIWQERGMRFLGKDTKVYGSNWLWEPGRDDLRPSM